MPAIGTLTPDILAATPHPAARPSDSERGRGPAAMPQAHHYLQMEAPPYSRAPLPMGGGGDQVLSPGMLPAMYQALPPDHGLVPHSGNFPVGRNTDLSIAGYQHVDHSSAANRTEALPDIVHSHNVGHAHPPRPNQHRSGTSAAVAASRHQRQRQQGTRHGGRSRGTTNRDGTPRSSQPRSRRSRNHSAVSTPTSESGRCKEPCVKCMVKVTSLRWVLLVLSMLGVLFVVSGIVMAALHAVGNDFLIFSLVFIGLGVVLVAVVVVAWKCTPSGSEPIHALFSIGGSNSSRRERRARRHHRPRDGQWHGGMMYMEFQYRRPPPTYAASMQAYQAQVADTNAASTNNNNSDDYSLPGSPPPSYRSRASTIHSGVHITFPPGHDSAPNSRPPTYRSRANSHLRPQLPMDSFEAASASTAPGDVAFTGPMMNADTVRQIIGVDRNHQRQRSAGAAVWHTHSSSVDSSTVPASDVSNHHHHHRRGASLDQNNMGAVIGVSASPLNQIRAQQINSVDIQRSDSARIQNTGATARFLSSERPSPSSQLLSQPVTQVTGEPDSQTAVERGVDSASRHAGVVTVDSASRHAGGVTVDSASRHAGVVTVDSASRHAGVVTVDSASRHAGVVTVDSASRHAGGVTVDSSSRHAGGVTVDSASRHPGGVAVDSDSRHALGVAVDSDPRHPGGVTVDSDPRHAGGGVTVDSDPRHAGGVTVDSDPRHAGGGVTVDSDPRHARGVTVDPATRYGGGVTSVNVSSGVVRQQGESATQDGEADSEPQEYNTPL